MNDYLSKPFTRAELLSTMERVHRPQAPAAKLTLMPEQVLIDEDVLDLVPGYLERCATLAREAQEAARREDLAVIRECAHKIKGSGTSYGFPQISELGTQLHAAAVGEVAELADEIAETLLQYLQNVSYQARNASSK